MSRPSKFTLALAEQICERLAGGESLRSICLSEKMPSRTAVFRWLQQNARFRDQYAHARELQADSMVDDMLSIADEEVTMVKRSKHGGDDGDGDIEVVFDPVAVQRNKLRIDTRKWLAAKMRPKVYGDKQETGEGSDQLAQAVSDLIAKLPS